MSGDAGGKGQPGMGRCLPCLRFCIVLWEGFLMGLARFDEAT